MGRLSSISSDEVRVPRPEDIRLPTPTPSEFRPSSPFTPDESSFSDLPKGSRHIPQPQPELQGEAASYWLDSRGLPPPSESDTPDWDSAAENRRTGFSAVGETSHPLHESRHAQTSSPEITEQTNRGRSPTRQLLDLPTALDLPNTNAQTRRTRGRSPDSGPRIGDAFNQHRFRVPSPSVSRSPSPIDIRAQHPRPRDRPRPPISARIRRALGLATPKASLIWKLAFGIVEIVVIGVLLGLASRPGSAKPIPGDLVMAGSGESQWEACDRPIAAWNVVWGVKAFLTMLVAWWEYRRAVRPR